MHPHGLADLLDAMRRTHGIPTMQLPQALRQLDLLDQPTLDALAAQEPELLGRRCTELVTRGVLTHEQLGRALARMSGLPAGACVDLDQAPADFVHLLFPVGRPVLQRPRPARDFGELADALEALQHQPICDLRQALLDLQLLDIATLDRLAAEYPHLLRERQQLLVRRALLTADELGRAQARAAGIAEIDAQLFEMSDQAFERMPAAIARTAQVLPLGYRGDAFFVASGTPADEDLRRYLGSRIGATVVLVWADSASILERVARAEHGQVDAALQMETVEWNPPATATGRIEAPPRQHQGLRELVAMASAEVAAVHDDEPFSAVGERSGMARLVRHMLTDARQLGASDIHVESHPSDRATLVRMRIDGDLRPYITLPASLRAALVSRIKVMSRLDISEHRRPQDGKIEVTDTDGGKLEIRVAVLPTHDGLENVVLRLLGHARPVPLASLGLQARDQATVERLSAHSFGLVLAAGPTGSGKTTTLHSMLMQVNTAARKIWTVEDPIEITQAGLNQVQVNARIGLTFATAMRSFLRADPDIIMVGEIRDTETARIAIDASLTGHLVLSTLHTNNAAESVMRLLDLGLDPINFADSLLGVLAQRLVRSLCPHCGTTVLLDEESRQALLAEYTADSRLTTQEAERRLLDAAGVASPGQLRIGVAHGCAHCAGKGYKGRMGVFEILENGPAVRELIRRNASPAEIFDAAVQAGMRSLRHDALEKAVQGRIDLLQARIAYL